MTEDGKARLIYTGEEMTIIDGKLVPESKNKGKGGNNANDRRIPRSSTEGHKRRRDNKNNEKPRHTIQPENNQQRNGDTGMEYQTEADI